MKNGFLIAAALIGLVACNKPSEGDCKKAIANIRTLLGTDRMSSDTGVSAAWVRSCRGNAKKSSVQCAMEASTVEQLGRCGLLKADEIELLIKEEREKAAAPPPAPPAQPPPPSAQPPTGTEAGTGAGAEAGTGAGTGTGTGTGTGAPAAPGTGAPAAPGTGAPATP